MAIGTAVKIGSTIITEVVFRYTQHVYQEKIDDLDKVIAKLNVHLTTLTDLRDEIPRFWDDEDSRKTLQNLNTTIQKVTYQMNTAQSLAQIFRDTVADLNSSKSDLQAKIQDAAGILEAIDL